MVNGEVQVANAAPSTRHWNVEPASVAVKVNVGVLSLPGLSTGVSDVSGATVSTVQVREAGVASTLPAASVARTSNVWEPWASPV